jgi:hypothetical protein
MDDLDHVRLNLNVNDLHVTMFVVRTFGVRLVWLGLLLKLLFSLRDVSDRHGTGFSELL